MDDSTRIEAALHAAVNHARRGSPPGLAAALADAVFPGGARVRPRLCLAVAAAFGDPCPEVTDGAAVAIELLHSASLAHDDLPCFDDASTRRGHPTVHVAHGQPLAVLAGDALIVAAFETLARAGAGADAAALIAIVARGVAAPHGIIAGQAWESERRIPTARYRRAKTASLFIAAASAGALAACADPAAWRAFGELVGEAYQVADDLDDLFGDASTLGKPVGRDRALGRPNAARELGATEASRALAGLLDEAERAVPRCPHPERIRDWTADLAALFARRSASGAKGGEARVAAS